MFRDLKFERVGSGVLLDFKVAKRIKLSFDGNWDILRVLSVFVFS